MRNTQSRLLAAAVITALAGALGFFGDDASAQKKIVCWKDKSGKVIGCGDRVPPEYQDAATKELDRRGVTRATTETAEQQAKAKALEEATKKQREDEKRKVAEQRRQDQALINTYTDPKEIDLKRDRELQVLDTQLSQLRVAHKNALDRERDVNSRIETTTKSGKPPTPTQKEDLAHAQTERTKLENSIAAKQKEQVETRARFAEMKKRYIELRGGGSPAPAATAAAPGAAKK
jgi:hypothetical protein